MTIGHNGALSLAALVLLTGLVATARGEEARAGAKPDAGADDADRSRLTGTLRVHPDNPRYFTDGRQLPGGGVRAVYLTGSHTWPNLTDRGPQDPPPAFDFEEYLAFLE